MSNHETWDPTEQLIHDLAWQAGAITGSLLVQAIINQERAELEAHCSRFDALTSLLNRKGLLESGEEQLRLNENTAVIFLDADKFKAVNDNLGHQAGDQLLVGFAGAISASVRAYDLVGRMGGDEFVVIMDTSPREAGETELTPTQRVELALTRIQTTVDQHVTDDPTLVELGVGMSGGFVLYDPAKHTGLSDLLSESDQALYANKQARRQRV